MKPIFQSIFGDSWERLPPVMHKHYANRPYSDDVVVMEGSMEVTLSPLAKLGSPIFRLTKTLIPKAGKNISVTVNLRSEPSNTHLIFDREFRFPDGTVHKFYSYMEPIGKNEIIEWTKSGIGWHAAISYKNEKVLLTHQGYYLKLFGRPLRLPFGLLFGKGNAHETATSDNSFDMEMVITHPLFGKLYGYSGSFTIESSS